jgi:hypothetical protein
MNLILVDFITYLAQVITFFEREMEILYGINYFVFRAKVSVAYLRPEAQVLLFLNYIH